MDCNAVMYLSGYHCGSSLNALRSRQPPELKCRENEPFETSDLGYEKVGSGGDLGCRDATSENNSDYFDAKPDNAHEDKRPDDSDEKLDNGKGKQDVKVEKEQDDAKSDGDWDYEDTTLGTLPRGASSMRGARRSPSLCYGSQNNRQVCMRRASISTMSYVVHPQWTGTADYTQNYVHSCMPNLSLPDYGLDNQSMDKRKQGRDTPSSLGVQRTLSLYLHGSQNIRQPHRRRASIASMSSTSDFHYQSTRSAIRKSRNSFKDNSDDGSNEEVSTNCLGEKESKPDNELCCERNAEFDNAALGYENAKPDRELGHIDGILNNDLGCEDAQVIAHNDHCSGTRRASIATSYAPNSLQIGKQDSRQVTRHSCKPNFFLRQPVKQRLRHNDSISRRGPSSLGVQRTTSVYLSGSQNIHGTRQRRASIAAVSSLSNSFHGSTKSALRNHRISLITNSDAALDYEQTKPVSELCQQVHSDGLGYEDAQPDKHATGTKRTQGHRHSDALSRPTPSSLGVQRAPSVCCRGSRNISQTRLGVSSRLDLDPGSENIHRGCAKGASIASVSYVSDSQQTTTKDSMPKSARSCKPNMSSPVTSNDLACDEAQPDNEAMFMKRKQRLRQPEFTSRSTPSSFGAERTPSAHLHGPQNNRRGNRRRASIGAMPSISEAHSVRNLVNNWVGDEEAEPDNELGYEFSESDINSQPNSATVYSQCAKPEVEATGVSNNDLGHEDTRHDSEGMDTRWELMSSQAPSSLGTQPTSSFYRHDNSQKVCQPRCVSIATMVTASDSDYQRTGKIQGTLSLHVDVTPRQPRRSSSVSKFCTKNAVPNNNDMDNEEHRPVATDDFEYKVVPPMNNLGYEEPQPDNEKLCGDLKNDLGDKNAKCRYVNEGEPQMDHEKLGSDCKNDLGSKDANWSYDWSHDVVVAEHGTPPPPPPPPLSTATTATTATTQTTQHESHSTSIDNSNHGGSRKRGKLRRAWKSTRPRGWKLPSWNSGIQTAMLSRQMAQLEDEEGKARLRDGKDSKVERQNLEEIAAGRENLLYKVKYDDMAAKRENMMDTLGYENMYKRLDITQTTKKETKLRQARAA